jgi:hypothetical protein
LIWTPIVCFLLLACSRFELSSSSYVATHLWETNFLFKVLLSSEVLALKASTFILRLINFIITPINFVLRLVTFVLGPEWFILEHLFIGHGPDFPAKRLRITRLFWILQRLVGRQSQPYWCPVEGRGLSLEKSASPVSGI